MAILEQYRYSRDPLDILIEAEARTCKGCQFEVKEKIFEVVVTACKKNRKHGKKCTQYKEKE